MNTNISFRRFVLVTKKEQSEFITMREGWKHLKGSDLDKMISTQREALKYAHWMNRVMPRKTNGNILRIEDNIRFLLKE